MPPDNNTEEEWTPISWKHTVHVLKLLTTCFYIVLFLSLSFSGFQLVNFFYLAIFVLQYTVIKLKYFR